MDFLIDYYYEIKDFLQNYIIQFSIDTKEVLIDNLSIENLKDYFLNYWEFYLILIVLFYILFNNNNGLSKMSKETLKFGGLGKIDNKKDRLNEKEVDYQHTKNEKDYRL